MMAEQRKPTTRPVKVLSIRQPWADLILAGPSYGPWKWAENRNWSTRWRGELFIHASSLERVPRDASDEQRELWNAPGDRITGAIVGRVDLIACPHASELEDVYWKIQGQSQRRMNDVQTDLIELLRDVSADSWEHVVGDYCFVLWNPRKLCRPIVTPGKLRIWNFDLPTTAD